MDKVNEWLKKTRKVKEFPDGTYHEMVRSHAVCKDGFTVSIQASSYHYCVPRRDGADKYEEIELGFPNMMDELIMDYAEDPDEPIGTVYGYVPIEIVNKLIEKHGGFID